MASCVHGVAVLRARVLVGTVREWRLFLPGLACFRDSLWHGSLGVGTPVAVVGFVDGSHVSDTGLSVTGVLCLVLLERRSWGGPSSCCSRERLLLGVLWLLEPFTTAVAIGVWAVASV